MNSSNFSEGLNDTPGSCFPTANESCYEPYEVPLLRHSLPVTIIYLTAYLPVFVMGVIGNSFVVAVVFRAPRMRSVTNVFIANLAVADLLVNTLCLPFTLIGHTLNAWVLGWFICKTVSYLQGVSVSASINTLVAITVDRATAICCPMKCQMTSRTCRSIILVIWLFSFTITLPWAIFFKLEPLEDQPDIVFCVDKWPDERIGDFYFVFANMIMFYILPLIVISICYIFIWHKVWVRKMPGEHNVGVASMMHRSKIKVIKMLLAVVVLFALSWLPLYVIFTRVKFGKLSEFEQNMISVALPIAQWLGASNSCINPILYAFFNNRFREGFKAILVSKSCCSPLRLDTGGTSIPNATQLQNVTQNASSKISVCSNSSSKDPARKSLIVKIPAEGQKNIRSTYATLQQEGVSPKHNTEESPILYRKNLLNKMANGASSSTSESLLINGDSYTPL